jgi:hypothetical protein
MTGPMGVVCQFILTPTVTVRVHASERKEDLLMQVQRRNTAKVFQHHALISSHHTRTPTKSNAIHHAAS